MTKTNAAGVVGYTSAHTDNVSQKTTSRSQRAGLIWPVSKTHRKLNDTKGVKRVGAGAPVYVAAVLESIAVEILGSAAQICNSNGRKRLTPADIIAALRSDSELNKMTNGLTVLVGDRVKSKVAANTIRSAHDKRQSAVRAAE